jgi:anionic cell wall polymer biosynthesis LytR-Cps2A-Psr (LCP) family protein
MFKAFQKYKNLAKKQKIIITIVFVIITLLLLSVSAFASYHYFATKQSVPSQNLENYLDLEQEINLDLNNVQGEDKKTLNILLAGYGGAGHQGGYLSDVIQVAHLNFEKKEISFISIPRDLYLVDKNQKGHKVNTLMSTGMSNGGGVRAGLELMQTSISQMIGLPIKYAIGIDFVGFQRVIGYELNTIEVDVAQTLEDAWYPIEGAQLDPCGYSAEEIANLTATYSGFELESKFACRYEHLLYKQGKVIMEGHDALAYVRSRHSSSDYDRSRRQVEVLTAIRNKLFKLEALKYLPKFYEAFAKHVTTNLDLESAQYLAPLLVNANEFTIKTINLTPENVLQSSKSSEGAFITIPKAGMNNWTEMQKYIKAQI